MDRDVRTRTGSRLRWIIACLALVVVLMPVPALGESGTTSVTLVDPADEADPLRVVDAITCLDYGKHITGSLDTYAAGGYGERHFGPVVSEKTTAGGGTLSIAASGEFAYTAPLSGKADAVSFTVADATTPEPLSATLTIVLPCDEKETPKPPPVPEVSDKKKVPKERVGTTREDIATLPKTGAGVDGGSHGYGASIVFLLLAGAVGTLTLALLVRHPEPVEGSPREAHRPAAAGR